MNQSSLDSSLEENDFEAQPLVRHLTELRNRLLYCVVFVALIFSALFFIANDLYAFVSEPLRQYLPASNSMIATDVASPFLTPFKLSFLCAIFLSVPFILYQIWQFVRPGLKPSESALALPILVSSILLFYVGITFAYAIVFPLVFGFFTQVAPEGVAVMTDIGSYLDFVIKLFFAFGFAFEIPVVTVLLIAMGITTRESLSQKRPYVFIACFVLGMLLTPPDILSQFLLAIPMWLLFEGGLLMSRLLGKRHQSAA